MTAPEALVSESAVIVASEVLARDPAEPGIDEVEIDVPSEKIRDPVSILMFPLTAKGYARGLVLPIATVPSCT